MTLAMEDLDQNQRQRQRRFHRRSRKGCTICKSKHLRCDEQKPLCSYCLKHGATCEYPTPGIDGRSRARGRASTTGTAVSSTSDRDKELVLSIADRTPKDPFIGTSYVLPENSKALFGLFARTRVLYTTRVERNDNSFLVYRALEDPGYLHAALLMTALQWAWETGDSQSFAIPYFHHKLETIRYVNEQLEVQKRATGGTVAAVASLALVESALGSIKTVAWHLRGLARIKDLHQATQSSSKRGLLSRLILMATRSVSSRPIWDMLDISRTDYVHQSLVISLLRVALRPDYSLILLSNNPKTVPLPDGDDDREVAQLRSVDSTRSGFLGCFFYLYVILGDNAVDPFIMHWFIEQLLADVCRTEGPMRRGEYSPSVWFWTVMFGACVASAAKPTSALEASQMKTTRDAYLDKINVASQLYRVKSWEGAKSVLQQFAWEDDFDGEDEIRALWEEAVWQDDGQRPKLRCNERIEGHNFRSIW